MAEKRVTELDLKELTKRRFFPSPAAWEDEVLYFLLLDRFSDGRETDYRGVAGDLVTGPGTPPFRPADNGNAVQTEDDARKWREAGGKFVGGTLPGLQSKLGYLRRLGDLGEPRPQAGRVSRYLSRLRDPELPQR
jgi:hypothetical protein